MSCALSRSTEHVREMMTRADLGFGPEWQCENVRHASAAEPTLALPKIDRPLEFARRRTATTFAVKSILSSLTHPLNAFAQRQLQPDGTSAPLLPTPAALDQRAPEQPKTGLKLRCAMSVRNVSARKSARINHAQRVSNYVCRPSYY